MTQCSELVVVKKEIEQQLTREESNSETVSEEKGSEEKWIVECICGETENDGEPMVGCDKCIV